MKRATGVLGVLAASALLLTSCAPGANTAWAAPEWPTTSVSTIQHPAAPIDPSTLDGLTAHRVRNDVVGIQARFISLPGVTDEVSGFNSAIDDAVLDAIGDRSAATGEAYEPAVFGRSAGLSDRGCLAGSTLLHAEDILSNPALGPAGGTGTAVVCDIVAANGSFFAERIRVVSGSSGGVTSDTSRILYVDTSTGETVDARDLWGADAAVALRDDVIEALRRSAGALSLAPAQPADDAQTAFVREALATTIPGEGGSLVFTVPAGFTAPELEALGSPATDQPMIVDVPASVVAEHGSSFGQRIAAVAGEPFAGPPSVTPGGEWLNCRILPCVALTYDDGPSDFTPRLLDEFAALRAPATFYMLGQTAAGRPDDVRRVAAEGHQIGNHTWDHPTLTTLTDAQIAGQLSRTRDLLHELSGQPIDTFRPPYGEYDSRVVDVARIPAILWSVDTMDWAGPTDDVLLRSSIEDPRPGGIVLFHDTHERSVRLAPEIVAGLRERGFTLATIAQLFGGPIPPGGYRSAG